MFSQVHPWQESFCHFLEDDCVDRQKIDSFYFRVRGKGFEAYLKQLWIVVLEKMLESPLDSKEIDPVYPKGNQAWIFTGRTDAEAEAPILWPLNVKSPFIGKDPNAGKDWRQEEKGVTENEIVGWHHWLSEHEFEQTPGDSEGQESLPCCSSCSCQESDTTE